MLPEGPVEPTRSLSEEPVLAVTFKAPETAELPADTTAFPEAVAPSVEATVTDDAVPVRSLSADLRLEPMTKVTKDISIANASA